MITVAPTTIRVEEPITIATGQPVTLSTVNVTPNRTIMTNAPMTIHTMEPVTIVTVNGSSTTQEPPNPIRWSREVGCDRREPDGRVLNYINEMTVPFVDKHTDYFSQVWDTKKN